MHYLPILDTINIAMVYSAAPLLLLIFILGWKYMPSGIAKQWFLVICGYLLIMVLYQYGFTFIYERFADFS